MMEYPFSVRDIIISDPFILADPVSKKYYTYAVFQSGKISGFEVPACFMLWKVRIWSIGAIP